jgi:acetolactate synthase-1/2/3 large subunit
VKVTGGQLLAASLAGHGVDALFLIPGIQLDWAVDALRQQEERITLFVPRHEQSTTYMADGYYRVARRPGVAMVVPGPGVRNAAAGLATAYSANSKVLFIAGQIHSSAIGSGLGLLHEIRDQTATIGSLTKWNRCVSSPADITRAIDQAFDEMNSGRPRPAGIEISHDLLSATTEGPPAHARHLASSHDLSLDTQALERAAAIIDRARFPIVFAGGGVLASHAMDHLRRFAEKLSAPVVMSDNGRGGISDRHPLAMSTLAGRTLFEHADAVVVVGSRFIDSMSPTTSWPSSGLNYVYVNVDRADFAAPRVPMVALHADAAAALDALCALVKPRVVLTAQQAAQVRHWAQQQIDGVAPQIEYIRAMRDALPEEGIFVNELTQVGYLARLAFPVYEPYTFISPGYQGTLGYGFPTALGAAVAARGRRVLSITGDGGFGWNLQELATARKYSLPVTLVVFNDGYYGNVRGIQRRVFGAEVAVSLQNPDFMLLARAFGVPGVRVETPTALGAEIRASLKEQGPVLIEVAVGEMPSPWHLLRLKPMEGLKLPPAPPNPLSPGTRS